MNSTSLYKKYLIPSVIARLSNLELKARFVVEGFITGLHKSPYHGFSVEFAEHRQYMPGDDIRNVDWKVLGRTQKYFVKQYEEETNLKSYILVDISKSMAFSSVSSLSKQNAKKSDKPTEGISKLEYASYIAASLCYLMLLQNDAFSLVTYDTKIRNYIPPHSTNTNLRLILKELSNIQATDKTGTASSLNQIAEKIKRKGLVIVLSDFLDNPSEVIKALRHFIYNGNEVLMFQILDPAEINLLKSKKNKKLITRNEPVILIDMETREEIFSVPSQIRHEYNKTVKDFIESYKTQCRSYNIDYLLIPTDTSLEGSLLQYLNKRSKLV